MQSSCVCMIVQVRSSACQKLLIARAITGNVHLLAVLKLQETYPNMAKVHMIPMTTTSIFNTGIIEAANAVIIFLWD